MSERIAVLSDTHSNHLATEAVLKDIENQDIEICWFLGDMLGRGAHPIWTARLLYRQYAKLTDPHDQEAWLFGNHDLMVMGKIMAGFFEGTVVGGNGKLAVLMAERNQKDLNQDLKRATITNGLGNFLSSRRTHANPRSGIYIAHARYTLNDDASVNEASTYSQVVNSDAHITDALAEMYKLLPTGKPLRMILTGHTHQAGLWQWDPHANQATRCSLVDSPIWSFEELSKRPIYVNPGSVGFPRDPDDTPTYVVLTLSDDLECAQVEFRRIRYDWRPFDNADMDDRLPSDYPTLYCQEIQRAPLPDEA